MNFDVLDEEIISGCSLAGYKRKLDRHLRDKRDIMYISFSFLPLYRQLDDFDSLTHQVQVQVQVMALYLFIHGIVY